METYRQRSFITEKVLDAKRQSLGVIADRGKIQVQLPVGRQNLVPHHSIVKELELRFPEAHFRITRIERLTHEQFEPSFADTRRNRPAF